MSPVERKIMINRDRTDLSLTKQCKLLKISRSSLYCVPVGMNTETLELMNEIDRVFTKYPVFGRRQITTYLPRNGFHAGRHRVRRLMGIMGLQAIYKGSNTSKKHPQHRLYPYLMRKLAITRPNHVWCNDITYIPVRRGFLYLVAIMDWATRKVLAWRLSNTLNASFCVEALKEAIAKKPSRACKNALPGNGHARNHEYGPRVAVHGHGLDHDFDRSCRQNLDGRTGPASR